MTDQVNKGQLRNATRLKGGCGEECSVKRKSRISIVCLNCAARENKEADMNTIASIKDITATSAFANKSVARGAREPNVLAMHADWRGDGNAGKRTKQKCHHVSEVPLLPCALFSHWKKKKVTSEWGEKSCPPAACQLNHVQIFTLQSRRGE